uniref:Uncharacterized protein n=1 Tax=Physcomitrium patens TaxID=3218 RepID=A0A2K1JTH7_PHYPA|nr:hypothetical protein PHYPA_014614 [Physcomitrium patens]
MQACVCARRSSNHRVGNTSSSLQKLTLLLLHFFFRRHRVLLLVPLSPRLGEASLHGRRYFCRLLAVSRSVHRSDQVFENLWLEMERADSGSCRVSILLVMCKDSDSYCVLKMPFLPHIPLTVIVYSF